MKQRRAWVIPDSEESYERIRTAMEALTAEQRVILREILHILTALKSRGPALSDEQFERELHASLTAEQREVLTLYENHMLGYPANHKGRVQ